MTGRYHSADADPQQSPALLGLHMPKSPFQSVATASPPQASDPMVKRERKFVQRGPHRGKILVKAVASIVSLASALALLAVCLTIQRRLNPAGAVRRSLSDADDDPAPSDILEQCLDLEAERGQVQVLYEQDEGASEAKARLVAMLHEAAADFERKRDHHAYSQGLQDEVHLPPPKVPRRSETLPFMPHRQASDEAVRRASSMAVMDNAVSAFDADAWVATHLGLALGEGEQQQHISNPRGEPWLQWHVSAPQLDWPASVQGDEGAWPPLPLPVGGGKRSDDALAPEAWLHGASASTFPQTYSQGVVDPVLRKPVVGTMSVASTSVGPVPTYTESAGSVARADMGENNAVQATQMKGGEQIEHHESTAGATVDASDWSASATAVRASSSRGGEPCGAGDIRFHPFVRLPLVNPRDVRRSFRADFRFHPFVRLPLVNPRDVRRSFRADFALVHRFGRSTPMQSYTIMRTLFSKASLTANEVDALMMEAELLASYAAGRLTQPCSRCTANYLVLKLSSIFMVFDHLVCIIELLGDKMNTDSWWPQFVQKFRTDYSVPEAARMERTGMLNKLLNRLSSALAIYKTGKRPPLEDVVELKRAILTVAYKGSQLSHPLWELWIQDDREFSRSSDGSDSPVDFQGDGR
ncbi:hypothetical protein EPH_0004180 [Eimeria praecox]|uniref:Uncharacterized protein n=1 Tax=Eimeria praecox TaxID=51316 RepID=U6G708_9EIME|nr:hypothetical protein EPH_0004180 [Eimeria praecox]